MHADAGPFYIFGAKLIDGTGVDTADRPFALLIEGRCLETVAPQSEFPCPDGAVPLDATGMTVMPGMIDCHDHLSIIEATWRQRAQIPPTLAVLLTAKTLHETLMTGFTAVRDAGGLDLGLKLAAEDKLIPSPRLKISVNIISQTGGHNHHVEPAGIDRDFPKLPGMLDCVCDGPEQCRRKAREMIFAGADWVKFCTTGGIASRIGGPLIPQFSPPEVQAIVDTAHTAGKPAMCHAYGGDGVDFALDAGVDSLEHGTALNDRQIEKMVKRGTWLVPTFAVFRKVLDIQARDPSALPAYMPRKAAELLELQATSFPKAMQAGIKIALGTDLGPFQHKRNAVEFSHMVDAGMTSMQAIVAGTRMAAECIGLGAEVGVLRPGMLADLLVINGNPLDDVRILQDASRISLIMQDGIIIKPMLKNMAPPDP